MKFPASGPALTAEIAARFAGIVLGHVRQEYPSKLDHVLSGPDQLLSPRALHPVFHGSFDWHSCVHGYWTLLRLLILFPEVAPAAEIRALLADQFTPDKIAGECAYLQHKANAAFERPYGWAWLLKLSAAAHELSDPIWADRLAPLAAIVAERWRAYLPRMDYPVRGGAHANTAFAMTLIADYAETTGDFDLFEAMRGKAADWYGLDVDCQAWEPSGDDFLSSTLMEAACMRRLLPPDQFDPWFTRFLPRLGEGLPVTLFAPARVADRMDGKIAHLDGLNLSRAWCWRQLARSMPEGDPRLGAMQTAFARHLEASLPHLSDDYAGEHWLTSFAVLALDQA